MRSHLLGVACLIVSCAGAGPSVLPLKSERGEEPVLTLVWVGRGEAERLEGSSWVRAPAFDYEFSVVQRRFPTHWESTKHLLRRHPQYDGSAGPREQTMFFRVDYSPAEAGRVHAEIDSTLGRGAGSTDGEFRRATLTMDAKVSRYAPFNTYVIDQTYDYEHGALRELVSLNLVQDGHVTSWVRNQEQALLFAPRVFDAAPTRFAAPAPASP